MTKTQTDALRLAHEIKRTMATAGIDPQHVSTWHVSEQSAQMVTWYGMALNIAGMDYCSDCGSERPMPELIYPYPEADCCQCPTCVAVNGAYAVTP